jgi:hypothetical protein
MACPRASIPKAASHSPPLPNAAENAANRADAQLPFPVATLNPAREAAQSNRSLSALPAAPACSEIVPCPRRHGGYTP